MTRVLLYSGGLDSLVVRYSWEPDVLVYVDTGTAYGQQERQRLDPQVQVVQLPLVQWEREDKIIPLRNLFLVCAAAQYGDRIALAATAGDRVLDKSPEFAAQASQLLSYLWQPQHWTTGRELTVELPVKAYTKRQLVHVWVGLGRDPKELWERSFSCYFPGALGQPCGVCKPCWRKWVAFAAELGVNYSARTREAVARKVAPWLRECNDRKHELQDVELALWRTA